MPDVLLQPARVSTALDWCAHCKSCLCGNTRELQACRAFPNQVAEERDGRHRS